jgi:hypothetical protein
MNIFINLFGKNTMNESLNLFFISFDIDANILFFSCFEVSQRDRSENHAIIKVLLMRILLNLLSQSHKFFLFANQY